jgi:hypothetical protein
VRLSREDLRKQMPGKTDEELYVILHFHSKDYIDKAIGQQTSVMNDTLVIRPSSSKKAERRVFLWRPFLNRANDEDRM